jgi:glycosyltransferase involved in cell wall biosynthesis
MKQYFKAMMIANKYLLRRFRQKFPGKKCYYAPGGVDINLFKPSPGRVWPRIPRVGWAGSKRNYGGGMRGLKLIRRACAQLGWKYCPAYREKRWRSHKEMVNYYNNEIDLYIDLWIGAGRQNGLLEAGACGVPLISCDKGIARELTDGGLQICNRTVPSIKAALRRAWRDKEKLSKQIANFVKDEWDWKLHVKRWEEIFRSIKRQ